jgi:alkylation response protein AidB-like acyl-CoA dehydrogenase
VELELTPDQRFFADTTRSFLTDRCPTSALRDARDDPEGFDRAYWRQGAELGWTSLLVPEDDGGGSISGRGLSDLTLVAFEFGRFAAPGPLAATNVVAGALARSGTEQQKAEVLPALMSGEKIGSWAYAEPRPSDRLGEIAMEATRTDGGFVLQGRKAPVESAGQCDVLLVTARDGDGLTQFLVPTDTAGVSVTPMKTVDLTRRFGRVSFDQVALPASAVVGEAGNAAADVEHQLQVAVVIQLAEMVGTMDRGLALTLDWLFNRYSFGRPLASYQELKHRFADMRAWLEAGHAIADAAAAHVQDETGRAAEYVSAGKSYLGHYGPEALHDCVQMHGGIGVTFEHDLHLFLRRVTLDAGLYGTVADHRERLTTILERQEPSHV